MKAARIAAQGTRVRDALGRGNLSEFYRAVVAASKARETIQVAEKI